MNKNLFHLVFALSFSLICLSSYADENVGQGHRVQSSKRVEAAGCTPASSQMDLYINDVRARMLNGGDMWWDLVCCAKYEVPKTGVSPQSANSLFAGSIWIAGIDENNQLKVAAATYRQNGNDYFPGPLDGAGGTTTSAVCNEFDHQWQVFGGEIDTFITLFQNAGGGSLDPSLIPYDLLQWPARNNPYNSIIGDRNLAPFADIGGTGNYDPTLGDYPTIGQGSTNVFADQMIWWCYNDNGNVHTESGGLPIGVEEHALAFAFQSSNAINDMTFYRYHIINKSSTIVNQCYMGQWVDPDLGNYKDDFIGSDPSVGLGICYNGEPYDPPGGSGGYYGDQPPLVAIDYFLGPINQLGDTLHMTNFMYYNNDFTVQGNPQKTSDYYGYLSTVWPDGTHLTYGGTGYGGGTPTNYAFPSDPTVSKAEGGWSECEDHPGVFGDRRMILSSGPFVLEPGAVNDIVIGVPWVRPPVGYYAPCPHYTLLEQADELAKALFRTNFKILSGPPPPTCRIIEESDKLILAIEGYTATESYEALDPYANPAIVKDTNLALYKFEGYQVYQLANSSVTVNNLTDPTQAQLIFQCDIKNGISKIINYTYDASVGATIPTLEVNGADAGIRHTFVITTDAFSTANPDLVNLQTYYFMVVPYAYNGYSITDTIGYLYRDSVGAGKVNADTTFYKAVPQTQVTSQQTQYLPSRLVNIYSGIPHVTQPEFTGLQLQSDYGSTPMITRQEGVGNGGLSVTLTPQSVTDILTNNFSPPLTYQQGAGPVNIFVYDPKIVPDANFQLEFRDSTILPYPKKYYYQDTIVKGGKTGVIYYAYGTPPKGHVVRDTTLTVNSANSTILSDTGWWTLEMLNGDSIVAEEPIGLSSEQTIPDWGLSVYISQVSNPSLYSTNNSVIGWSITYANPDDQWLSGIPDVDNNPYYNWILAGSFHSDVTVYDEQSDYAITLTNGTVEYEDPIEQYATIFNRTIAPYRFCSMNAYYGPILNSFEARGADSIQSLPSIDIVYTPDTALWTRCCILETEPEPALSIGNIPQYSVRHSYSVNKSGTLDYPTLGTKDSMGMGWFPGYAVDPESGFRLNIMFGEDSWQVGAGGSDMIWDPTSTVFDNNGDPIFGGRQWVYVMKTKYDSGQAMHNLLFFKSGTGTIPTLTAISAFKNVAWVEEAMLAQGQSFTPISQGLIPNTTTLSIRINSSYTRFHGAADLNNMYPRYTFNTHDIAALKNDLTVAKSALDTIKIVPNPYYAYSQYETSKIDTRVRIANIPVVCTITIYSLDGTLIRTYNVDNPNSTFIDWDLNNFAGIPVASGIYLVHVNAPGIGEKTLKWFGIMRPIDLDSF